MSSALHIPETNRCDVPRHVDRHRHTPFPRVRNAARPRAVEAPLIALYENEAAAEAALPRLGSIRVLGQSSSGVRMLAPAPGLRETLYASGALLVVG
ncbi:hypothetical protein ACFQU7_04380 [Pseudoroseomonas wenyumeiae]